MELKETLKQLNAWYKTPLGISLNAVEGVHLKKLLSHFFGDYLLEEGVEINQEAFALSKIANHIYLTPDVSCFNEKTILIKANPAELPFYTDIIDVVLVSHLLEFVANPYSVLQEIYHTLVPSGKVVILCFNPCSLWGLCKFMKKRSKLKAPWHGHFISSWHMRSWLLQLGFSIEKFETFYFKPPIANPSLLKVFHFAEKIGKFIYPYLGGCYIFVAEKKMMSLTPVAEKITERRLPMGAYVKPAGNLFKGK